jgi:hypothetical protein
MDIEIKEKDIYQPDRSHRHSWDTLFNGISEESKKSKEILSYFKTKFCHEIAVIALLKCCCIASSQLDQKLNLFVVAPPGQFKSVLDKEVTELFPKNMVCNLGSDMTIHALHRIFKGKIPKTCLVINDYTMLVHTKDKRTRLRLEGGLAEIMSEKKYTYGDFEKQFVLDGDCSILMNMSYEAFNLNKNRMFLDRILLISFGIPIKQQQEIEMDKIHRLSLEFDQPKFRNFSIEDYDLTNYRQEVNDIGTHYAIKSMQSYNRTWDLLRGILKSHAYLNKRNYINDDDLLFLKGIEDFIGNKFSKEGEIVELWIRWMKDKKDFTKTDLAEYFKRDTNYINKLLFKAKLRGLIEHDN